MGEYIYQAITMFWFAFIYQRKDCHYGGSRLSQQKQIVNLEQQLEIQKKLTEIAEKSAEVEHIAYERQEELTDRAIKLAEVGRSKSNWGLQGLLSLAAFAFGFFAGR